jgi:hypothetical protein
MRNFITAGLVAAAALAVWTGAQAGGEKGHGTDKGHVIVRPDSIQWVPAPPGLPAGARIAVLSGDPTKTGLYALRVKMSDGYKIPPHWHPTDENVTVLHGTLMIGKGDKFSANSSEALTAGSFMRMPKEMRHFAWAKGDTIIQVHGIGPFEINYVNASDDPRKK